MSAQSTRIHRKATWRDLSLSGLITIVAVVISTEAFAQTDALPSWNDTATKKAIIEFVIEVSTKGGADFVPEADRIAAFDMDGTLTPEHPMPIALIPVFAEVRANVVKNPLLGARPAVAALLNGDLKTVVAQGEDGQVDMTLPR